MARVKITSPTGGNTATMDHVSAARLIERGWTLNDGEKMPAVKAAAAAAPTGTRSQKTT